MKNMEFRDLKRQYQILKKDIDSAITIVMEESDFISGRSVSELEKQLADYVGVKHCITCANGTDALSLAVIAWEIGAGDAVFVPNFTFFSSGEIVAFAGATPVFVDVDEDTFNMSAVSFETAVKRVLEEGKLRPKAVIPVDLFGLPANYDEILPIAQKYGLKVLEDGAQGFGGAIKTEDHVRKVCSFGDIATTSFFPAKPLGCYGDGGAIFTDDDSTADFLRSLRVHGKGDNKYDNVRIGMNSRLDTIQAAILQVKFRAFQDYELRQVNEAAERYTSALDDIVKCPKVPDGYISSWAQYSILLKDRTQRDSLQVYLKNNGIPSMIYYPKPMSEQKAFSNMRCVYIDLPVTDYVCNRILSLPMHPYLEREEQGKIVDVVREFLA